VRTCNPNAQSQAARSYGTVLQLTHWHISVETTWCPSTTKEVKTIFSVTSTCIKLVRYTERGRELDRAARQIVQRIEEDVTNGIEWPFGREMQFLENFPNEIFRTFGARERHTIAAGIWQPASYAG
jgi:hypothetical protein